MLRVLKLHVSTFEFPKDFIFNQQAIIDLVLNLPHLEKLFLLEILLKASTVVNVIRFGTKLEIFHFHHCNVQLSESKIREIVNDRKSKQHKKVLTLFVDEAVYRKVPSVNEIKKYLRVDFGCQHDRFNW